MDKIVLKNMGFYGYHGVLPEEKSLGQRFFVDLIMYLDLEPAGKGDDLNLTVNYAEAYAVVEKIVTKNKYDLLEAVAEKIIDNLRGLFPQLQGITVEVRKPAVPIAGLLDYAAVVRNWGQVE